MLEISKNGLFVRRVLAFISVLLFSFSGNHVVKGNEFTNQYESKLFKDAIKIEAGYSNSFAVKGDGTVWGWGGNLTGKLGIGKPVTPYSPVKMHIDQVQTVSSAALHTLILKNDGSVWVTGSNYKQVLGIGETTYLEANEPIQIEKLSDVISISTGHYHSMALKNDGTVWVWGSNEQGQLGDSEIRSTAVPILVKGLPPVKEIYAGDFQSYAIDRDGAVWVWGIELVGGSDSRIIQKPIVVEGTSDFKAIAETFEVAAALKGDGTVWMWRSYTSFRKGETLQPVKVSSLDDVISISGGSYGYGFMAVKSDGTVWRWKPRLEVGTSPQY